MGTRKSRHNKGRKALYKEHRFNIAPEPEIGGEFVSGNLDEPALDEEAEGENIVAAANLSRAPLPNSLTETCKVCAGPCSFMSKTMMCRGCFTKARDDGTWVNPKKNNFKSPCVGAIVPDPRPSSELLTYASEDAYYHNNWRRWSNQDEAVLATLVAANATADQIASILHREPTRVVYRAHSRGLKPSHELLATLPYWSPPKTDRRWGIRRPRVAKPAFVPLMQFPYVRSARSEYGDLLAVNTLVPRGMPEETRADVCQSIMLAVIEGTVTVAELERNPGLLKSFISKFRKAQTPWQEITGFGGEDDERSYEDIAASNIRDWSIEKASERRSNYSAFADRFTPPPQIHAIYEKQIAAHHKLANERGRILTVGEAARELEDFASVPER